MRKTGCAFCYSADDDKRALAAWADGNDRRDAGSLSMPEPPLTVQGKEPVIDLFIGGAVKDILLSRQPCRRLVTAYKYKLPYLSEPAAYPTLMRQLCYEVNFVSTSINEQHVPATHQIGVVNLLKERYTINEMMMMGLTFPMILYSAEDTRIFTSSYLFDNNIPTRTWSCSLVNLLLAGLDLNHFHNKQYTDRDLRLLEFHVAAFLAAGGGASRIRTIVSNILLTTPHSDLVKVLHQFGYVPEMESILKLK
jgi:hypothetical protein